MNKIYYFLFLAVLAFAAVSCDPVDESERYTKADDLEVDRKVLVEEYTGQFCPNCPLGHEALDGIKSVYKDNVVIVSLHAGDLAYDDPVYGLKTPDGDKYAAMWGIQAYPSAVVNRTSGVLSDRSLWQGGVMKALTTSSTVKMNLEAMVQDGKINITAELFSVLNAESAKCQLWITEDNVVALQQNETDYIMDYVHNHVYRASVNGIGGEDVTIDANGTKIERSIAIASNWNVENLNVVAFVYNSKGVLQAEEVKLNK